MEFWHLLNGNIFSLENATLKNLHAHFASRMRYEKGMENHMLATLHPEKLIQGVSYKVTIPTLIIHSSEDPIFSKDHGDALAEIISHAQASVHSLYIEGLGHVPSPHFYELMIQELKQHAIY